MALERLQSGGLAQNVREEQAVRYTPQDILSNTRGKCNCIDHRLVRVHMGWGHISPMVNHSFPWNPSNINHLVLIANPIGQESGLHVSGCVGGETYGKCGCDLRKEHFQEEDVEPHFQRPIWYI